MSGRGDICNGRTGTVMQRHFIVDKAWGEKGAVQELEKSYLESSVCFGRKQQENRWDVDGK